MLLLTTDNLTRAIIIDTLCEKERFCAFRSKGSKAFQVVIKLLGNVFEIKLGIKMNSGFCLFGRYMVFHILLKPLTKQRNIIPTERQTGCISVASEVHQ